MSPRMTLYKYKGITIYCDGKEHLHVLDLSGEVLERFPCREPQAFVPDEEAKGS